MSTFIIMVNRIVLELRRSNLITEAKSAVNDAIREAAKTRFYFNEMLGVTFNTVIGQEYYPDQGLVEIDAVYNVQSGTRYNITLENNLGADDYASGNVISGRPDTFSRASTSIRLNPVPNTVTAIFLDGYGKLTPYPLVADADTNAWMTDGELYIRALAKRNLLRDVIRDYGEARVLDAVAQDYKEDLEGETSSRGATGTIRATSF